MSTPQRSLIPFLVLALAGSNPAAAQLTPTGDGRWYYRIGGAEAVTAPLNAHVAQATLGGSLDLGAGFNCQGFDATAGIRRLLSNLENAPYQFMNVLSTAATNAVANLPAMILQRANPGLYELMQEALGYANGQITLATKSCERMQSDIARGRNPFDHWLTLSKSYDWRNQMGRSGTGQDSVDVLEALTFVEANQGKNGVPWVGGERAGGTEKRADGSNQPPIRLVSDVVKAGYTLELGRSVLDFAELTADERKTRVGQLFGSADAVEAYAVAVLGDLEIQTQAGAERPSIPGHGLLPQVEADRVRMTTALTDLVAGTTAPTPEHLAQVSPPGTLLTREVLDAIRALPERDRPIALGKLAGESAVATHLERAMLLRRLLLVGSQEPNVHAAGVGEEIARLVAILDREVDQLLYETRLRREIVADTAGTLLDWARARSAQEAARPGYRPGDARPVEGGAVKP
jgi:integrating conjugative element protein (TIGR03755 family)